MEILMEKIALIQEKLRSYDYAEVFHSNKQRFFHLLHYIKNIGVVAKMEDYEKRKLTIFNQLNFFQLVMGIAIPIIGVSHSDNLPSSAWLLACLPACISVVVLFFNHRHRYEAAQLSYFI